MAKDLDLVTWILVVTTLTFAFGVLAMMARWSAIRRPGGAVECSLRLAGDPAWRNGVAAYRTDKLFWFRSYGVGLRPDAVFDRHALRLVSRHEVARSARTVTLADAESGDAGDGGLEEGAPGPGTVLVQFRSGTAGETLWLALTCDALTGLLAWLEASPQPQVPGLG